MSQPQPQVESHQPVVNREPGKAGGRFALVGEAEVLTIHGRKVTVQQRADGAWLARTPDLAKGRGVRNWQDRGGRASLLAKVDPALADIVAEDDARLAAEGGRRLPVDLHLEDALVAESARRTADIHLPEPQDLPHHNGGTPTWAAIRVDPEDFPLAVALDDLEAATAPALAALERAGKVDAAALVRAEVATTPAEAELLRLWRLATNRPE
jgi:hypothetical protein